MTTAQAVGAVSREAAEWYAIDWRAINRNVRRLQVRIVQATKASRWGRVRALQRLLTHSYSGKVLAVRRVTENNGKKTPGVDQEIWDTPEKKTQAVHALKRRGYQSQPLRRVYIPKSDGKTMRPLGIPTMRDRAQQALYLLALAPVMETTADKNSYGFRQQQAFEGLELGEGKPSRPVLRGPGGCKAAWLLGRNHTRRGQIFRTAFSGLRSEVEQTPRIFPLRGRY